MGKRGPFKWKGEATSEQLEWIEEEIRHLAVPVDQLEDDPDQVRDHPAVNRQGIRNSLADFGLQQLIVVDRDGRIISGHGRVHQARELGREWIAVLVSSLEGDRRLGFSIADNKTSDTSRFRVSDGRLGQALKKLMEGGLDPHTHGWQTWETDPLIHSADLLDQAIADHDELEAVSRGGASAAAEGRTVRFMGDSIGRLRKILQAAEKEWPGMTETELVLRAGEAWLEK